MLDDKLTWTDVEDLGIELAEQYPQKDPMTCRFTELRQMVESLPNFEPEPGQHVNEQILEAIQAAWIEERSERTAVDDDEEDDDGPSYSPPVAYKPD